ncbi:hypothetical protein KM043_013695 [Ampulex compressa]|nr:hypothetical protein KM043_013695 [Ampulex compressa]
MSKLIVVHGDGGILQLSRREGKVGGAQENGKSRTKDVATITPRLESCTAKGTTNNISVWRHVCLSGCISPPPRSGCPQYAESV